jgi:hypothetical protein
VRGMPALAVAIAAVLVTTSACTPSKASPSRPSVGELGAKALAAQQHLPPLQTAAQYCIDGIGKASKDAAISARLDTIDPTGGEGTAWTLYNLQGDQVQMKKGLASGQVFAGTFDLGQIIWAIIGTVGEQATKGTPDEFQWSLFSKLGPAAIYCTEAAFWLDGTVGGQIGTALQKKFLTFSVGQQLLASRSSAISGNWVLYRKLKSCGITGASNHGCVLNPLDATVACTGTVCTFIRTNASPGYQPWDHPIPLAFSQGAWRASGTEKWAAECNHAPVPGTGVALTLTVTSGQVDGGVWRAQGLTGTYTINNAATSCYAAGTSVEQVSTTPFAA